MNHQSKIDLHIPTSLRTSIWPWDITSIQRVMKPGHQITPRICNILHFRQLGSPVRFALALALVMPICRIKKSVTAKIEFAYRQLPESAMVKEGNSHSLTTLAKPVLNVPASSRLSRESRALLLSPSKSPIRKRDIDSVCFLR
jgi:hypothetical protein